MRPTKDWGPIVCCLLACCALVCTAVSFEPVSARNESREVSRIGPCPLVVDGVCPDSKFIKYFLFTKLVPSGVELVLEEDGGGLGNTTFDPTHPTKIAIHGWGGQAADYIRLIEAYQSIGSYNVIVADYARLTAGSMFCYPFAVLNAAHVGRCVAQLVQRLRATGARDLHVIGFSLGAHVAAIAARELRPYLLPRITGLDPAKPLFSTASLDERLDPSDAVFVDVMHTSAGAQGMVRPVGHVDFYANGGSAQPGCGNAINGCSHVRAQLYFVESITTTAGFWCWQCEGLLEVLTGRCLPKLPATLMGEHTPISSRGVAQCNTGRKRPYALGPWLREEILPPPQEQIYFGNIETELLLLY